MKVSIVCMALLALLPAAQAADEPPPARNAPAASNDHLAMARKAIDAQNWSVAERELNVALKESPQNADVYNLLGYTSRKRSNPDLAKAFQYYNMALKIDPQHKGAHEYIGEAYLMDHKPQEAQVHLVALEKICGTGCEEYQDLAKAIADYKAKN